MTASETYNTILQTARRLFIRQGYTATSMRQIAAEAGIGKATIYHHFTDKRAIATELIRGYYSGMENVLQLVRAEGEPVRCIQAAAKASIDFLYEYLDIIQIVRREVSGIRDEMQTGYISFSAEYLVILEDAVKRGVQQGIFRPVDAAEAARVLLVMIQGTFAMTFLRNERSQSPEKAVQSILDVYFEGISAH